VAYLYLLNLLMVGLDTILYFRNRRLNVCACELAPAAAPQRALGRGLASRARL
jgi:hypothetical protein